jgi:hypothetical protein
MFVLCAPAFNGLAGTPLIVTLKEHVFVLPQPSVICHVTVDSPVPNIALINVDPVAGFTEPVEVYVKVAAPVVHEASFAPVASQALVVCVCVVPLVKQIV